MGMAGVSAANRRLALEEFWRRRGRRRRGDGRREGLTNRHVRKFEFNASSGGDLIHLAFDFHVCRACENCNCNLAA